MIARRKLSRANRVRLWNMMNRRCAYCGQKLELSDMCVDHVRPLSQGGRDTVDNMVCSCWHCNQHKAQKSVDEFRSEIQGAPVALFRESAAYREMLRYNLVNETHRRVIFYFEKKGKEKHVSKQKKRKRHRPYY